MSQPINTRETAKTQARYNRIAPVYDLMEISAERRFIPWRRKLWSLIPGGRVLEVGVGTGKNLPHHPARTEVTGIELSERMLVRARQKIESVEDLGPLGAVKLITARAPSSNGREAHKIGGEDG